MENENNLIFPDRLKCVVCGRVLDNPRQHECGERFCASCVERLLGETRQCPGCGSAILGDALFPDAAAKREIVRMKQNPTAWSRSQSETSTQSSSSAATAQVNPSLDVVQTRLGTLLDTIVNLSQNMTGLQTQVMDLFHWKNEHFGPSSGPDQLTDMRRRLEQLEDRINADGAAAGDMAHKMGSIERSVVMMEKLVGRMDLPVEDGVLTWKIESYQRRKQEAIDGSHVFIDSESFETHRFGYKMCLRVFLYGDDAAHGECLSVYLVLLKGDYDNLLPFPVDLRITFTLLDQQNRQEHKVVAVRPDPGSFHQPTAEVNPTVGVSRFVQLSEVESLPYQLDDSIYLKVAVERLSGSQDAELRRPQVDQEGAVSQDVHGVASSSLDGDEIPQEHLASLSLKAALKRLRSSPDAELSRSQSDEAQNVHSIVPASLNSGATPEAHLVSGETASQSEAAASPGSHSETE